MEKKYFKTFDDAIRIIIRSIEVVKNEKLTWEQLEAQKANIKYYSELMISELDYLKNND